MGGTWNMNNETMFVYSHSNTYYLILFPLKAYRISDNQCQPVYLELKYRHFHQRLYLWRMLICVVSLYGQKCDKVQMIHQTETYFTTISLFVPKFVYCHLSPLFYLSNNMQCNAQNLSLAFFHIAFSTVLELDQWLLFCCNHWK